MKNYRYEILQGYNWYVIVYDGYQEVVKLSGFYDYGEAEHAAIEWIQDHQA